MEQRLRVEDHLGLVYTLARRFARGSPLPVEDLVQEGAMGLMRAVEKFDPSKGVRFSTYATYWIRAKMSRASLEGVQDVRLPEAEQRRRKRAGESQTVRIDSLDADLSDGVQTRSRSKHGDDLRSLHDILAAGGTSADAVAVMAEEREALASAFAELRPKWRQILRARFLHERTLEEIGRDLGVSRESVRQIEAKALEQLRRGMTRQGFKSREAA